MRKSLRINGLRKWWLGAELNRRFDSANYPVRALDGFKPRRSKTSMLCRQASFARRTHCRLSRPTRRTRAVGALRQIGDNLAARSVSLAARVPSLDPVSWTRQFAGSFRQNKPTPSRPGPLGPGYSALAVEADDFHRNHLPDRGARGQCVAVSYAPDRLHLI
jgi:hypothetical protein